MISQPTERLVGFAQIALSVIFVAGYFLTVGLFILGYVRTPAAWEEMLKMLLGLLTAGVLLILQFWFSRARPQGEAQ
jgi:hypothetical protein